MNKISRKTCNPPQVFLGVLYGVLSKKGLQRFTLLRNFKFRVQWLENLAKTFRFMVNLFFVITPILRITPIIVANNWYLLLMRWGKYKQPTPSVPEAGRPEPKIQNSQERHSGRLPRVMLAYILRELSSQ
jgi:hypothetical protein